MQKSSELNRRETAAPQFFAEIESGLLAPSPSISPKFLYDSLGSHLFTAITLLPEYYPTTTEREIFNQFQEEIVKTIGIGGTLIDLGAGNCNKAELLFDVLKPSHYLAIDFSEAYLGEAISKLRNKYPKVSMNYVGMDFSKHLQIPDATPKDGRTFFYPGSSIGNFSHEQALELLTQIHQQTYGGGLLLGVDLMKDDSILMNAYDDPLKITSAFNLNILRSINTLIGSNFKVEQFRHKVIINHMQNRIELYLEALEDLTVTWPGNSKLFKEGDLIHTENSHKYTTDSIELLLKRSGFKRIQTWTDSNDYFAVIYAQ
jgi:dimethylhistidine N-methyltransferase